MNSYAQVTINSQCQVWFRNFIEANKQLSQSFKQLQFIITSVRVNNRDFQQVHILNYLVVFYNC